MHGWLCALPLAALAALWRPRSAALTAHRKPHGGRRGLMGSSSMGVRLMGATSLDDEDA